MNNLQEAGLDLRDLKYIQIGQEELDRYRLESGDILFNRTNSKELVGKCEVFREPGDWVFASYLIRVRLDADKVLPQFASDFLNTRAGRLQIDRLSRQIIGMTNINAEELKEILLPIPPALSKQRELVATMDLARAERRQKRNDADSLLTSLDDFLLSKIGLVLPPNDESRVFAASLSAARDQSHLNADYFHPERILALRAMQQASERVPCVKLAEIVSFVRNQIRTPGPNYVGLAHVQGNTGELVASSEEATGACSLFEENDVLFARLRPYLNKVYRAEMDGCCSPEFHVLRINNMQEVLPDYLGAVLRSRLTLAQTRHMMTGNTHPRLTNEDVVNLMIPIPRDVGLQKEIVEEVLRRRIEARRLRAEGETDWQSAKRSFEVQLLNSALP